MLVFCYLVDEGGGEVSLVPVAPNARRIFVCIFVCAVFLVVAQCWRSSLSVLVLILTLVSTGRPGRDAESV